MSVALTGMGGSSSGSTRDAGRQLGSVERCACAGAGRARLSQIVASSSDRPAIRASGAAPRPGRRRSPGTAAAPGYSALQLAQGVDSVGGPGAAQLAVVDHAHAAPRRRPAAPSPAGVGRASAPAPCARPGRSGRCAARRAAAAPSPPAPAPRGRGAAGRRRRRTCRCAAACAQTQSRARGSRVYSASSGVPGSGSLPVGPAGQRRHRHQDRFGAAARLQAEMRAAVPHQVELDIAAAPVQLEVALALAVGRVLAALHDRQVGVAGTHRPPTASGEAAARSPARRSRRRRCRRCRAARCGASGRSTRRTSVLKRGYLSAPKGASASLAGAVEVHARPPRSRSTA